MQLLRGIAKELAAKRGEYASAAYVEHEVKMTAWFAAKVDNARDSTTFRNNAASYAALEQTRGAMDCLAEIRALEDERQYLELVVQVHLTGERP